MAANLLGLIHRVSFREAFRIIRSPHNDVVERSKPQYAKIRRAPQPQVRSRSGRRAKTKQRPEVHIARYVEEISAKDERGNVTKARRLEILPDELFSWEKDERKSAAAATKEYILVSPKDMETTHSKRVRYRGLSSDDEEYEERHNGTEQRKERSERRHGHPQPRKAHRNEGTQRRRTTERRRNTTRR